MARTKTANPATTAAAPVPPASPSGNGANLGFEAHGGKIGDISIYGQESNYTTWRLATLMPQV